MISRGKAEKQAARTARLSAALRENLKRRKAQARGRETGTEGTPPPDTTAERRLPTFAAIRAATRNPAPRKGGRGGIHGSHPHSRRPAA